MPKNLILVRHGQSEGNAVVKSYEKDKDESFYTDEFLGLHESQYLLTALGEEQAKKAGVWLKKNGFDCFDRMLVSSIVRAQQTAVLLDIPDAEWMVDFNLRERDHGLFNVMRPSKKDKDYADQQIFHDTKPFLFRPPQGESIADLCHRVKVVLDTLGRECDGEDVIIVCHGHVIRAIRIILERFSPEKCDEFLKGEEEWAKVPNCSIVHYTRTDPSWTPDPGWPDASPQISKYFGWVRMIRPSGGGNLEDEFTEIVRKKYTNEELWAEAMKQRKNIWTQKHLNS